MECRVPLKLPGLRPGAGFCANLVRTTRTGKRQLAAYWRGNPFTVMKPVVYARFGVK